MAQTTNDTTPLIGGAPTGKTVVVDPVVAKIVGVATRAVPGVHALGGGAARVIVRGESIDDLLARDAGVASPASLVTSPAEENE